MKKQNETKKTERTADTAPLLTAATCLPVKNAANET